MLLSDLGSALAAAAAAGAAGAESARLARLQFAHAETLAPLATLLGLVGDTPLRQGADAGAGADAGSSGDSVQRDTKAATAAAAAGRQVVDAGAGGGDPQSGRGAPVACPAGTDPALLAAAGSGDAGDTDADANGADDGGGSGGNGGSSAAAAAARGWGARVSPLGANLLVLLYRSKAAADDDGPPKHLVRVALNEQLLPLPLCGGATDCELGEFLRRAVAPRALTAEGLARLCGGGGGDDSGLESGNGGLERSALWQDEDEEGEGDRSWEMAGGLPLS